MRSVFYEPYFEPEALSNLKYYRYSAVDKSLVYNHVLRHWCDLFVKLFPMWMAPNLITLSGFGFIVINVLLLSSLVPSLLDPGPPVLYLSFAIGLFLYQTFDNCDGRQARRTGSSSALGHIFDHTIDSLNCALCGLLQAASISVGPSPKGVFLILVGCAAMWFSTWEEYHTGTLYLGYFNGPTEGVLIACAIHVVSAVFGPNVWQREVRSLSILGYQIPSFHLYDIIVYLALLSLLTIHIPECLLNVYKSRRTASLLFLPTLKQHLPFFLFLSLSALWVLSPNSQILRARDSAQGGLIEFALLITFAFGKLSPRIILARLTRSAFPGFTNNFGAFVPLAMGVGYVNAGVIFSGFTPTEKIETLILHVAVLTAGYAFLRWAHELIDGFTRTLGIGCFTLKSRGTTLEPKTRV